MSALERLLAALASVPPTYTRELDLQAAIEARLVGHGFTAETMATRGDAAGRHFVREAALPGLADRPDFLVDASSTGGTLPVAVEVKVAGALTAVTRQLHRYAGRPEVSAVVLVTTRSAHRRLPDTLQGKPLRVVYLSPLGGR